MIPDSKVEPGLGELKVQAIKAVEPLFHPTNDSIQRWQGGWYFSIFARPSKRIRAILDVEREVLIAGNVYVEQQARSLNYAKAQIDSSDGRLEPKVCLIIHCDPKGNSKLKKWGRQQGITVIPIYARNGRMPSGADFERALSFELFSQDPFDVTGPVETDAQFFGRRTEAQELARKLQGGQIRAHLGIRKIGKTSIMHRVLQEVREHYDCDTIFIDCQTDGIFRLNAAQLVNSIAAVMEGFRSNGSGEVYELTSTTGSVTMDAASQRLNSVVVKLGRPCIIAFDEVDYITPGSPTAAQWRSDFIEFWRNIRAAYQAASRADRKLSVLVCGVSSKWFSVESIDGIENAALSFIPEEYLSPLPRGASTAMIKNIGTMAGLQFDEDAADTIAAACSDMPFWIRKACSYIHGRTDTAARPLALSKEDIRPSLDQFVANDGADLAHVALQHLFRVYPELRGPAIQRSADTNADIPTTWLRTLQKYGLLNARGEISGQMVREGVAKLVEQPDDSPTSDGGIGGSKPIKLAPSDWIEEIQIISRRRNMIERKTREIVFNFLRFVAMSSVGKSAKDIVLEGLQPRRREELRGYKLEEISERIYWLELINIITKNWSTFEKVFNDQRELRDNATLVNDRPDAHAKEIDLADVALYRRATGWFEQKLENL